MIRSLSFRRLLALLYFCSVAPLLIAIGFLVHIEYRAFLIAEHRATLMDLLHTLTSPATVESLPSLAHLLETQLRGTDFQATVFDIEGRPVGGSHVPLLNAVEHAALRGGAPPISREVQQDGIAYQVYALALRDSSGRIDGIVEGSFATSAVEVELRQLTRWLVATIGSALLLAILLSPLVARLAVRPLRSLIMTVQAIHQGRFDARARPSAISELGQLALTLNAMLDRIQATINVETRTATALRRFVADASHELRTPLAVIGNGLEVLDEAWRRQDAAQIAQTLTRLKREQEMMRRLVDDLLLLARMDQPDSRGALLNLAPVEPLPLLEEVTERAQMLAQGQIVRLTWRAPLPADLFADANALRRALGNLTDNALRYTPPGRAITLSVAAEGDRCRFTVADEGPGVAPEHLPHLGERFYRADPARGRYGGAGLGLAIVRAIAEAHGGRLEISSTPGAGFTASIVIPTRPLLYTVASDSNPRYSSAGAPTKPLFAPHQPFPSPEPQHRRRHAHSVAVLAGLVTGAAAALVAISVFPDSAGRAQSPPMPANQPTPAPLVSPRSVVMPETQTSGIFDRAVRTAAGANGGIAIAVEFARRRDSAVVEVTLSDGSRVVVDAVQQRILRVKPAPAGRGRGIERQQQERARIATAAFGREPLIGFDAAAAIALDTPHKIELVWRDDDLWYEVAVPGHGKMWVHATSGTLMERP